MTRTSNPCDETAIPANGATPIVGAAAILAGAADSIGNGAGIDNSFHVTIEYMNLFD
jgi:hypothetical protein